MTLEKVLQVLRQAKQVQTTTIDTILFEGGEPFLCYSVLVASVQEAHRQGFKTGIVSNGIWANSVAVAIEKLQPMAGQLGNLTISSDDYHRERLFDGHGSNALAAATQLGIPCEVIEIANPGASNHPATTGQIPAGKTGVMYRGRAAEKLVYETSWQPWEQLSGCPYENLRDPGRMHLDPFGNLHICEGISLGNVFKKPLKEILESYDPDQHPIVGPIERGGPAELCRTYRLPHQPEYADACHLCYLSRKALRTDFPEILAPDQVYGVMPVGSTRRRRMGLSLDSLEPVRLSNQLTWQKV